jgi:hypothetical protein
MKRGKKSSETTLETEYEKSQQYLIYQRNNYRRSVFLDAQYIHKKSSKEAFRDKEQTLGVQAIIS